MPFMPMAGAGDGRDTSLTPSYRYDRIQILRFIAATAVVLFHAVGTAGRYFTKPSSFEFGKHGDLGVDLFFVISGFIMVLTVSSRETEWRLFLRRRVERIVPLYWIATMAMTVMLAVPGISSTPPADPAYIVRSLLFLSWTGDQLPLVYPGWTIEFEVVFYLLISAAMIITIRPWGLALAVLSGGTLAGAAARVLGVTVTDGGACKLFGSPMLIEFALGVVVGHLISRQPLPKMGTAALAAAILGIAAAPSNEFVFRFFVAGIPSALIVLAAAALDRRSSLRSRLSRLMIKLGDASYAIYLVQIFVISIGCKILQKIHPSASIDLAIVATTVATLIVAWYVHRYVERPIGRWLRRSEAA